MPPKNSLLGDMSQRIPIYLRLPRLLVERVEEICYALGVPKNAFFAIGAATLALNLLPLMPGKKRPRLLADLEKFVQDILANARKAL
ncbi:MAG: hypothetical protein A2Y61_00330 [Chloroflexi bacterium RBG_13_60_13]|nr:MAG: hypothetical protein A2Y61_00330 [Chloroflexi bacterium RBG_13_60_13]